MVRRVRAFMGTTIPDLRRFIAEHQIGPAPISANAVTDTLRKTYPDESLEELEFLATVDAALWSLGLVTSDPAAPPRRVVVAVDVSDSLIRPRPESGESSVEIAEAVGFNRIASVHLDEPSAEPAVRALVESMRVNEEIDESHFDAVEEHDLLWYARQELPYVL